MTMLAPWLVVSLLAGFGDPEARPWIDRLASGEEAEVFAAIDALDAMGVKALPALREAASGTNATLRRRAEDQILRIGARRLLRPTVVSLDLADVPAAEALTILKADSGTAIDLDRPDDPRWLANRASLRGGGAIPLFEAIDRLGSAGGFRLDTSHAWAPHPLRRPRVRVVLHDGPRAPASYAGPYRFALLSLNRHREAAQTRDPSKALVREEFSASFEAAAEPGVLIERNGPIHLVEAVDDRGRDLASPSADAGGAQNYVVRSWDSYEVATLPYRLPLGLPEDRGRSIARLRGDLPILAYARTDEVASWPMSELNGKSVAVGGATVTFLRVTHEGGSTALQVSVRGAESFDPRSFASGPRQVTVATPRPPVSLDDLVRVEDDDGIPYRSITSPTSAPQPDGTASYLMSLYPGRPVGPPSRVRVFGIAVVATELPFDFRDLPIP